MGTPDSFPSATLLDEYVAYGDTWPGFEDEGAPLTMDNSLHDYPISTNAPSFLCNIAALFFLCRSRSSPTDAEAEWMLIQ